MDECIKTYRKSIIEKKKCAYYKYQRLLDNFKLQHAKTKNRLLKLMIIFNFIKSITKTEAESFAIKNDDYFLKCRS